MFRPRVKFDGAFSCSAPPEDFGDRAVFHDHSASRKSERKTRRPPLVNSPSPAFHPIPQIIRGSHAGLPRRRRTDRTRHLSFEQVVELVNATRFAHSKGHPLLVHITVIWAHFEGFAPECLAPTTTKFFDAVSKWLRRRGVALRAVWVRERGQQKGHHLHALVNLPIRFVRDLEIYLQRRFAIAHGGLNFSYGRYGMHTQAMQLGVLRYICKTLDHRAFKYCGYDTVNIADAVGIQHVGTDGPIHAKRAGTTANIGRKARRVAGWRDARSIDEIADALNPASSKKKTAA